MPQRFIGLGVSIVLLAVIAVACGGGHGTTQTIRTEKGLDVAPPAVADGNVVQVASSGMASPPPLTGSQQATNSGTGVASGNQASIAYPYPFGPSLQSQTGITVPGYGRATVAADSALLYLYLGGFAVEGVPVPGTMKGPNRPVPPGTPVSDADVQAVVDAIATAGVMRSDISVERANGQATITATIRHVDAVDAVEKAAQTAAQERGLQQSSNVTFTVSDCAGLEGEALKAAISDAHDRGATLAQALNVGLGSIVGSSYAATPNAPGMSACESGGGVIYPLVANSAAVASPTDVQVSASVVVTFALK